MVVSLKERLRSIVDPALPLRQVVDELRALRDEGVTRGSVEHALHDIRLEASDDAAEDRILEALDFVTGFASPDNRIWE